ncbi:agmatine deiminase family protein [Prevotella sp. A2931]|uniref:Agmatine deiminase family protein n=1 Tax=Prevotella illustrans TaxID=2800387 RepID=A0ABS3M7V1_9BACT|nr:MULTISPECIES: agmatine deiminase family protein [Prevotella]MBO1364242.1 agmatine deiminase family protein [Prevotella illustrans]PTL26742.1 agamatine deiminase [Prevotella sp. oral taxon 820]
MTTISNRDGRSGFILPAEWERQSCIQLTWPHAQTDWLPYLEEITATFIEMTDVITRYEPVLIVAQEPETVEARLRARLSESQWQRVRVCPVETNDTWARDHGGITLVAQGDGQQNRCRLLDFKFNGWGGKFEAEKDNAITRTIHAQGALRGKRIDLDDFVLEGGSIESDGKGTVFTTSMCLLAPHRNQPLTRRQIEERLKQELYARRIVWLDHGNLMGDDTDGHIDTIVRTAPNDTLLYIGCDDPQDEQFDDFKELETQLMALTTNEGLPFRLLRLPMPTAIYDGEDRLPATYANFVIMNGAVMVPTYGQQDTDQAAMDIIAQAFPTRDIIGVDASTVIRQHGSLHCLTMQYPEGM